MSESTSQPVAELADFDPSLVSESYDFYNTKSGQLHLETVEAFGSIFGVPNEWLRPEFVDHRFSDDHTNVELINGKITKVGNNEL
jgi:hypothetical protein